MDKRYNLYNLLHNFTHYLIKSVGLSSVSAKNYKSDIGYFIRWLQNETKTPLELLTTRQITAETISEFRLNLESSQTPVLVNRKLSSVRSFLRYLESKDIEIPSVSIQNVRRSVISEPTKQLASTQTELITNIPEPIAQEPASNPPLLRTRLKPTTREALIPDRYKIMAAGAGLLLLLSVFAFGLYLILIKQVPTSAAFPQSPTRGSRTLSFQGRLTDSLGNPITASTNVVFKLYTALSGGSQLYTTGTCSVTPDQDGIFNSIIGEDCGSEISSDVFTENADVYLGITVGSDSEMDPRQQIANVGYALNAETLQGLPIGSDLSTVPYINKDGNVLIGASAPGIRNTYASATFVVSSANAVTLQSAGSGDVTLTATESGTLKFLTGGAQAGVVTNGQLWGFGTTGPDAKVDSLATSGEQLRLTYTDGSAYTGFTTNSSGDLTIDPSGDDLTIGGDAILTDTFTLQVGGKTGTAYNAFANSGQSPAQGAISSDNDVYIGGDLEVTGAIYGGSLTASNLPWSGLTDPTTNLTLAHNEYTSTFNWDTAATAATLDGITLAIKNDASTDSNTQRLLVLNNTDDGGSTGTSERLLVLDNKDTNEAVTTALEILASSTGTITTAIDVSDAEIGTALSIGANDVAATNYSITGATGNITTAGDLAVNGDDITSDGTLTIDAVGDINLDADGADIFLKDGGATFATLTNTSTDLTIDAAGGQVYLANGDTLNIGGVTGLAYNAISDSGTTSHGLSTDNDLYIEGDAEVDGTLYVDGTLSAGSLSCTDCLDFTSFADSLTLDATTDINLGTNNLSIDLDSTGDFAIRDGTTAFVSFNDDSTTDWILPAVGDIAIDAATTDSTVTTGVFDLNVDAADAVVTGLNIDFSQSNGATTGRDAIAQAINLTANDADGDVFGLVITGNATANAAAGSYEALLKLTNAENTSGVVTDGILINSTSGTNNDITDAIDVSDANIVNAINVGANTILGTTAVIDLTNFDVDASGNLSVEGAINDISGNLVLNDTVDIGSATTGLNVTTAGVLSDIDGATVNINDNLDVSGTLFAGTADAFQVDSSGNITGIGATLSGDIAVNGGDITATGDLTINPAGGDVNLGTSDNLNLTASSNLTFAGTTTLAETTAANDSGAYFVGAFDEFDNSNSTTVQGVLNDLDAGLTTALGNSSPWTDSGTTSYLTNTTDEVVIGGSTPLSSAKLSIDGDADQIQLIIQGNATQTSNLATFEDSTGTDLLTISGAGVLSAPYLVDISNSAYGIDPAGTGNFGGYSLKVTGGALLAADSDNVGIGDLTPDAKLNIKATTEQLRLDYDDSNYASFTTSSGGDLTIAPTGSDTNITGNLAISGTTTIGDAGADTVTNNAAVWTFANDTDFTLSGGVNGLSFDGTTLSIDATGNAVGFGTAGPDARIDSLATSGEQLRLTYTDGAIYAGFTVDSSGNLTIDGTGSKSVLADDLQVTGNDILDSGATSRITLGSTTTLTNSTLTLSGTSTLTASSLTAFNCSDCIDFDDMEDTLDLDAALTLNQSTNTWTQNFTGTTTDGLTYNGNSLSTGNLIKLSSTSTAFSSGSFINADWSPGSTTTNSGDLLKINTGSNANLTGNYINLLKGSSTLFKVAGGTGNVTTEGDLAVNGGDITSSAGLTIDVNTDIITPDKLTVGTGTAGVGQLNVSGKQTGKALTILNETGDQNILVASLSGTTKFVVGNDGAISPLNSEALNAYGDSQSLVINSSFEVDTDGVSTNLPDGWFDSSGTSVRETTTVQHGDYSVKISNSTDEIKSSCFPIAGNAGRTYTAYAWLRHSAASGNDVTQKFKTYTTKANCAAETVSATTTTLLTANTNWQALGAATYTPGLGDRWARVFYRSNSSGTMYVDGVLVQPTLLTAGLDLAETYPAAISDNIQIGEIVDFGTAEKQDGADVKNIKRSSKPYDNLSFGVIATNPGIVLDDDKGYEKVKVALKGRVPVLVSTENGPIHIGDAITASSKPGIGMKATRSGRILGYAMTEWTDPNPDTIEQVTVFVNPETVEAHLENVPNAINDSAIQLNISSESAHLNTLSINGEIITAIRAFNKVITASLKAGYVEAKRMVAESIDATNATFANLTAGDIHANYVVAENVDTDTLTAKAITTDTLNAGAITADTIDSSNIRELQSRLLQVAGIQDDSASASSALAERYSNLSQDINDVQSQIESLKSEPLSDPQYYQSTTSGPLANLTVTGATSLYDLYVAHATTIDSIYIDDTSIAALSDTLHLTALNTIDLLDGAVIIARDGSITAQGQIIAKGGIKTDVLEPINTGDNVAIKLSSAENTDPLTGIKKRSEFVVTDETNKTVAGIDSSGNANVNGLSINGQSNFNTVVSAAENNRTNGIFAPSVETHAAAAGSAVLPSGSTELLLYNDNVTDKTLMYITPTSYTYNKSLYVASKEICPSTNVTSCKKYVRIALDQPIAQDVTFNWWIIN